MQVSLQALQCERMAIKYYFALANAIYWKPPFALPLQTQCGHIMHEPFCTIDALEFNRFVLHDPLVLFYYRPRQVDHRYPPRNPLGYPL